MITNQHVVDGAQTVSVRFANGKSYSARVVGSDPSTDIAVLDVDAPASALKPIDLADSSAVEVGDGVIAIGSPFGLEQTVTTGIVSALHRQITAPNNFSIDNAIQTDAAINQATRAARCSTWTERSSASTRRSRATPAATTASAIPSNTVGKIAAALISDGSVEHLPRRRDGGRLRRRGRESQRGAPGHARGPRRARERRRRRRVRRRERPARPTSSAGSSTRSPGDTVELKVERDGETDDREGHARHRPSA